jgi:hypothetical protein
MDQIDITTVYWATGLVGVTFYLSSYTLLQAGLLRGASVPHTLMNMTAATLVLVSLAAEWSTSSALIQVSWITISIVGLTRLWLRSRRLRFSGDEREVLDACFATMSKLDARRVLDLGIWVEAPRGYVLTEQDMPVEHVYYVQDGHAEVCMDGRKIAKVSAGGLIGEMGCLTHGAASATVTLGSRARLFRVRSDELCHLVRRAPDLRPHLEYAFAHATRRKLLDTNAALRDALNREQLIGKVA